MPHGKPAGVACAQLDEALRCRLFGMPERPAFCASPKPGPEMCGESREEAMAYRAAPEIATRPPQERRRDRVFPSRTDALAGGMEGGRAHGALLQAEVPVL
jgi:hypothetical protein